MTKRRAQDIASDIENTEAQKSRSGRVVKPKVWKDAIVAPANVSMVWEEQEDDQDISQNDGVAEGVLSDEYSTEGDQTSSQDNSYGSNRRTRADTLARTTSRRSAGGRTTTGAPRGRRGEGGGGVFKQAAVQVLRAELRLMPTAEIARLAIKRGLVTVYGKTPEATMASALYTDVKRKEGTSIFIRPAEGLFGLREWIEQGIPFSDAVSTVRGTKSAMVALLHEEVNATARDQRQPQRQDAWNSSSLVVANDTAVPMSRSGSVVVGKGDTMMMGIHNHQGSGFATTASVLLGGGNASRQGSGSGSGFCLCRDGGGEGLMELLLCAAEEIGRTGSDSLEQENDEEEQQQQQHKDDDDKDAVQELELKGGGTDQVPAVDNNADAALITTSNQQLPPEDTSMQHEKILVIGDGGVQAGQQQTECYQDGHTMMTSQGVTITKAEQKAASLEDSLGPHHPLTGCAYVELAQICLDNSSTNEHISTVKKALSKAHASLQALHSKTIDNNNNTERHNETQPAKESLVLSNGTSLNILPLTTTTTTREAALAVSKTPTAALTALTIPPINVPGTVVNTTTSAVRTPAGIDSELVMAMSVEKPTPPGVF